VCLDSSRSLALLPDVSARDGRLRFSTDALVAAAAAGVSEGSSDTQPPLAPLHALAAGAWSIVTHASCFASAPSPAVLVLDEGVACVVAIASADVALGPDGAVLTQRGLFSSCFCACAWGTGATAACEAAGEEVGCGGAWSIVLLACSRCLGSRGLGCNFL
jgi:hypothetical protein